MDQQNPDTKQERPQKGLSKDASKTENQTSKPSAMHIEQIYTNCLAEAAYYIESNGEAAIIDPLREVAPYLQRAEKRGARIKYILETHFHADFVSGHIDLARETGAEIVYGPGADAAYEIHEASDGESLPLGDVTIEVLHTPGHTLESSTYLLRNEDGKEHAIFTGDTLFTGDVGRPDLAVKSDLTEKDLAGKLYDSLRNKIMPLPDDVIVYPGHGAGSACGKHISSDSWSTLGEQKKVNYALRDMSKEQFIEELTTGLPKPPQYFVKDAAINKKGYEPVEEVIQRGKTPLSVEDFAQEREKGTLVLDTRAASDFHEGFIPGSINIHLDGSYAVWVGTLIEDMQQPILVVAEPGREEESVLRLARVGYDNAIGYLEGGFEAWKNAGKEVDQLRSVPAEQLTDKLEEGDIELLDVRNPGEYETEHLEGARSFPLGDIRENLKGLDPEQTYYIHCKSGYRSMIAASILKQNGFKNLVDIGGGFDQIRQSGIREEKFVTPTPAV